MSYSEIGTQKEKNFFFLELDDISKVIVIENVFSM